MRKVRHSQLNKHKKLSLMDAAGGVIFLLPPLGNRRWEFKKYTKKKYKQKMEEIRKLPRYRSSLKKKTHKKCYRTSFKIKSKKYTIDQEKKQKQAWSCAYLSSLNLVTLYLCFFLKTCSIACSCVFSYKTFPTALSIACFRGFSLKTFFLGRC